MQYFQVIVTGSDVAEGKPDPGIYRIACQRLGVTPGKLLAFEDAVSGVLAARGAGIQCIGVGQGEHAHKLRQAGAADIIENFEALEVHTLSAFFEPARKLDPSGSTKNTHNLNRWP